MPALLDVILAAFLTTLVVRQFPYVHGWVERGVKPWACDACCASWLTLGWRLTELCGAASWDAIAWVLFCRDTAALAACTYLLLRIYRVAEVRFGVPDLSMLEKHDYEPPR